MAFSFSLLAAEPNLPPTVVAPATWAAVEDQGTIAIPLTGVSPGSAVEAGQKLTFSASVVGPQLVWLEGFDHLAGSSTATLRLHTMPDAVGTTRVLLNLLDDGGTADGGSDTTGRLITITVAPVNDPPRLEWARKSVARGGLGVISGDDLQLTDKDSDPATLAATLTAVPAHGTLLLAGAPLAVGGRWTMAEVAGGLLTYRHDGGGDAIDAFSFTYTDGTIPAPLGPGTCGIGIGGRAVPTIGLVPTAAAWRDGDPPLALAPLAVVEDTDSAAFFAGRFTAAIASGAGSDDRLTLAETGGVALAGDTVLVDGRAVGSWSGGADGEALTVAFTTADATPAAAGALLRALRFHTAGRAPLAGYRSVRVMVDDGDSGPSVTAEIVLTVSAVDDPPRILTALLAAPAGVAFDAGLAGEDPDSPLLAWTAVVADPGVATATLGDAASGRLRIHGLRAGRTTLAVTLSDGVNAPVAATLPLIVSAGDDEPPALASEPPAEAAAGEPWEGVLRCAGGALEFLPGSDCPAGLALAPLDAASVRLRWTPPAGTGAWVRFRVVAVDAGRGSAAALPVLIRVRPRPGGSG